VDGRVSRSLVAIALGLALLAGAFHVASGEGGTSDPIAVTAYVTHAETVPANATVYRHDGFPLASPVHRAVERTAEGNGSASVTSTVEDRTVVQLPEDSNHTSYYVRRDRGTNATTQFFEVTVERMT
jgi:hypothetical protein